MNWAVVDHKDSTRPGEVGTIPFVLQLPRQNQALQVRKARDRALVKTVWNGPWPWRQGRRPWPGNSLPPYKAGKEVRKEVLYSRGHPALYGFGLTSGGKELFWEGAG